MNIAGLQACLASCVKYIVDNSGITYPPYFNEIPENYYVPSVYFPVPRTESHKVTLSSWRTDIYMESWFAARTNWEAFAYAEAVRNSIIKDRCAISILDSNGDESGSMVRISEPSIRKQEERIVRMAFTIKDYHEYDLGEEAAVSDIHIAWSAVASG